MSEVEFDRRILIDRNLFEWIFEELGGGRQSRFASNLLRVNKYSEQWDGEHNVISKQDFEAVSKMVDDRMKMDLLRGGLHVQDLSDKTPNEHLQKRSVHAILLSQKEPLNVSILTTEENKDEYENGEHLEDYHSVDVRCEEEALELLEEYREKVKIRREMDQSGVAE